LRARVAAPAAAFPRHRVAQKRTSRATLAVWRQDRSLCLNARYVALSACVCSRRRKRASAAASATAAAAASRRAASAASAGDTADSSPSALETARNSPSSANRRAETDTRRRSGLE
jgi:hypothetical protein